MRSYDQSLKSKKTVASMITRKGEEKPASKKSVKIVEEKRDEKMEDQENGNPNTEDLILANRKKMADKMNKKNGKADKQ